MKYTFPEGFQWGVATAAYQIEGAYNKGGKGESIWDRLCHTPGKVKNNETGDVACDHYHRYEEDIRLMKELGVKTYRLSISWTRIFPDGKSAPNQKGIEFYRKLIKLLRGNGIIPAVTLYHWDLPQKLQDMGGWANREVADYFEQYARFLFKELGDIVPIWITHNEPWVTAFSGNWLGLVAPCITDFSTALLVSHNLLLSHGKVVKAFREMELKGEIGITLHMTRSYPASERLEDVKAADRNNLFDHKWFSDPILKGRYPQELLSWYKNRSITIPDMSREDLEIISTPIDFLGVNYYLSSKCKYSPEIWPLEYGVEAIAADKTDMGWNIYPQGLYDTLMEIHKEYAGVKILITENGAAFNDIVNREGKIEDDNRLDYFYKHFIEINRAIKDGINIQGYYLWSLLDNFEWNEGYDKRFGIVFVDYKTQKRIIKKSGYWYQNVIRNNGF